jgi:hypothetical protein
MTMARWFTKRDREHERRDELLSAYLDGQLGAEERARLEAQLASDPALRVELEALRRTVALVRDLPRVPVPRNFILPQTMVARPRPVLLRSRRLLAPLLTTATSIAALLLVVVLVGDLLSAATGRRLALAPGAPAAAPVEQPQAVVTTVQVEQDAGTSATAPALAMGAPTEETPAAAGEESRLDQGTLVATPSPPPPAPATAGAAPEEGTSAGSAPPQPAAPTFGAVGTPAPTPTQAAEMERAASPATVSAAEGAVAATPSLPTVEATVTLEGYSVSPAPTETARLAPPAGESGEAAPGDERLEREAGAAGHVLVSPRRGLEIALGLAALALGAGAVWAWRARRR